MNKIKSVDETFNDLKIKLSKIVPEAELLLASELIVEIEELKKERNAVILGHNYMEPALYHSVPDYKGDSLELSRRAAETKADIIVFCGVEFMAETAKILSPEKTVLVPSDRAGCSLAESITAEDVRALKKLYPNAPVVTYVNTYADVKAETDICCTSSNAVKVVNHLATDTVIFLPDAYLAANVARETGKKIVYAKKINGEIVCDATADKNVLIVWQGFCEVHDRFSVEDVQSIRKQSPETMILAHPECKADVVEACDFSGSTSAMIKAVKEGNAKSYALFTECSMGDNIIAENQDKELLRMCSFRCPYMAQITLEMTRDALKYNRYEVNISNELIDKARLSLNRMLEIH
ncbi:MAG: quinolinate synthase NadA [Bdellovibrionota bacterium]